ncbi:MAG: translation factor Sua5 [Saprospiraceae bacterium]|nr:MAG: translation factor Sua5 [Saprospiraceae bacterium]
MMTYTDLEPAIEALRNGNLILYPTDTVWCVGCDATNEEAVRKARQLRQLPPGEYLILLVASIDMLKQYVGYIHPRVETLLAHHQRPLTMVFDTPRNLPQAALHPDGTVALRVCKEPFCQTLIEAFGKPLVATAACVGNAPIPTHFGEVSSEIIENVKYVVRHRQLDKQMESPSVIARLNEEEELDFLRH